MACADTVSYYKIGQEHMVQISIIFLALENFCLNFNGFVK